jgi:hypothetical protein
MEPLADSAAQFLESLKGRNLKLVTAESCTAVVMDALRESLGSRPAAPNKSKGSPPTTPPGADRVKPADMAS